MEIKLGRGQFQAILRDGDVDAIAAGDKDMHHLRKSTTPRYGAFNQYSKSLTARYLELGHLLEALSEKKRSLKNVPEHLTTAIKQVVAHRKVILYQLPGDFFVTKAVNHLDRGDGFWGQDYNQCVRYTMERQWSAEFLEHIKTLPECAKFWA